MLSKLKFRGLALKNIDKHNISGWENRQDDEMTVSDGTIHVRHYGLVVSAPA